MAAKIRPEDRELVSLSFTFDEFTRLNEMLYVYLDQNDEDGISDENWELIAVMQGIERIYARRKKEKEEEED